MVVRRIRKVSYLVKIFICLISGVVKIFILVSRLLIWLIFVVVLVVMIMLCFCLFVIIVLL